MLISPRNLWSCSPVVTGYDVSHSHSAFMQTPTIIAERMEYVLDLRLWKFLPLLKFSRFQNGWEGAPGSAMQATKFSSLCLGWGKHRGECLSKFRMLLGRKCLAQDTYPEKNFWSLDSSLFSLIKLRRRELGRQMEELREGHRPLRWL